MAYFTFKCILLMFYKGIINGDVLSATFKIYHNTAISDCPYVINTTDIKVRCLTRCLSYDLCTGVVTKEIPSGQHKCEVLGKCDVPIAIAGAGHYAHLMKAPSFCPGQFFKVGLRCYLNTELYKTFPHGKKVCEGHGAELLALETQEEFENFKSAMEQGSSMPANGFWLGLTDMAVEGVFIWESSGIQNDWTYWMTDEPSDSATDYDCASIGTSWKWRTRPCARTGSTTVCETSLITLK